MRVRKVLLITTVIIAIFAFVLSLPSSASSPGDQMIDTDLLHSMVVQNMHRMEAGQKLKFTIIDARTLEEFKEAHVLGAISVPEKDFEKYQKLLPQDKNALMIVYCNDTKCVRSKRWVVKAIAAGYTNVVIYSDGFPHWQERKLPVAF